MFKKKKLGGGCGGWLNVISFWWEIYTLIWCSARPQNEKWTPNACGYWEFISFLSIKLWVALIESPASENPKLGDPEQPPPHPPTQHERGPKRNLWQSVMGSRVRGQQTIAPSPLASCFLVTSWLNRRPRIISMAFCGEVQSAGAKSSSPWLR